jgi:hypothetical protein
MTATAFFNPPELWWRGEAAFVGKPEFRDAINNAGKAGKRDQAERIFLNFMRGCGLTQLCIRNQQLPILSIHH